VQTTGCQPVVRAFERGESKTAYWDDAHTVAAGLRVPKPLGDVLTLAAIRESGGTAIAVSDQELLDGSLEIAAATGIFAAPEGGACLAALKKLVATGFLKPDERIMLYNTGTGLKYLEAFSTRFPQSAASEHDKLGGLITPR
jgi:threonine synthase